jgi:hypothetical protein
MRPSSKQSFFVISLALFAVALTGCGAGSKVVSSVKLEDQVVNGDLVIALDATLAAGPLVLPKASFPLYNPKNPSQVLGEVRTDGRRITVAVDATQALKLPDLADGTKLPNGSDIPLALPSGLQPIGIPVFNSNSRVYLAINGGQIMAGVAITIAKEDRLNLPIQIFLPFNVSNEIHGTGGFFLGEKQGVAVFALREKPTTGTGTLAGGTGGTGTKSLAAAGSRASLTRMETKAKIEVKEEEITRSKVRRLEKTWNGLRSVRID